MTTPSRSASSPETGSRIQARGKKPPPPAPKANAPRAEEPKAKSNGGDTVVEAIVKEAAVAPWNSLLDAFGIDPKLSAEGVWCEHPLHPGLSFRLARLNLTRQRDYMVRFAAEEGIDDLEKLSDTARRQVLCRVMAETVLMDWKGVKDAEGNEMPYTSEHGLAMLLDKRMEEWTEWVMGEAFKMEHYRAQSARDDGKK